MEQTIASLNIEHFRQKLETETDKTRRRTLVQLLSEEQAKLAALVKNPRTKSTFDHSYLAPPFPFSTEQLASNKACATRASIRPRPERVRARLALPRSQPHIFSCDDAQSCAEIIDNPRTVSTSDGKCRFKFTSKRLEL
jgi:hypothetical protein